MGVIEVLSVRLADKSAEVERLKDELEYERRANVGLVKANKFLAEHINYLTDKSGVESSD